MKKNYLIYMLLSLFLIQACRQEKEVERKFSGNTETVVSGKLHEGRLMEVILEEMGTREYIPVDTVQCGDEGKFRIAFSQKNIAFYVLRTGGSGYLTLLLEPGEKLHVEGNYGETTSYQLKGSPGSKQLAILNSEHKRVLTELLELSAQISDSRDLDNYRQIRQDLDQKMDSITATFHAYSLKFIETNSPSPVMLIALYNLYGRDFPVFDPDEDFAVYLKVDSLLQKAHPDMEASRELHSQLMEVRSSINKNISSSAPAQGQFAPDFVSSRPDGTTMSLSELRGKWVLLGFWASWSKPGREDAALLKRILDDYGENNFTILQLSFDSEREAWTEAINELGLDWHHLSDLKGWDSPVADLYQVERIPAYYLIDPSGRIASGGIEAPELNKKMNLLLNK